MEEKYGTRVIDHRLTLENREEMEITGVMNVDSFDDEEVVMDTEQGLLAVRGENLNIKHLNLDQGEVRIAGMILELAYSDQKPGARDRGKGFFERLFK
ncbi:MAG: sporulation protein YabP [Firmicutes bacterium]|nr:sporulation protein YabP [Bacillota bacterium]